MAIPVQQATDYVKPVRDMTNLPLSIAMQLAPAPMNPVIDKQVEVAETTALPAQQSQPLTPYGLSGSEQALQAGLLGGTQALQSGQQQALSILDNIGLLGVDQLSQYNASALRDAQLRAGSELAQARQQAQGAIGSGLSALEPFRATGLSAQERQAALSGALGAEAQQQAFDEFIESPGQEFLRERGQRELLSANAAIGGLGGGRVREELVRFGTGLAAQDLANQQAQLNALRQGALQAAGQQAQLSGQSANILASLGGQASQQALQSGQFQAGLEADRNRAIASILSGLGSQAAGITQQTGRDIAGQISGTGQLLSSGRLGAGQQIAQAISGTGQGLSSLAQQQGSGLADIISGGSSNIANLLSGSGQFSAQQQQQLAQILANINTGQGSQLADISLQGGATGSNLANQQGQTIQNLLNNLLAAYATSQAGTTSTNNLA